MDTGLEAALLPDGLAFHPGLARELPEALPRAEVASRAAAEAALVTPRARDAIGGRRETGPSPARPRPRSLRQCPPRALPVIAQSATPPVTASTSLPSRRAAPGPWSSPAEPGPAGTIAWYSLTPARTETRGRGRDIISPAPPWSLVGSA
jgi:hypothetical protein